MEASTDATVFRGYQITTLPPQIARMSPKSVAVSPHSMTIEFHGGFDHFGFKVWDQDRFWEMGWYTEQGQHSLLNIGKKEGDGEPGGAANRSLPVVH
jgi:hypothetical protein